LAGPFCGSAVLESSIGRTLMCMMCLLADASAEAPTWPYPVLEFLNNLWGLGTE
jgi:hypothetical protein